MDTNLKKYIREKSKNIINFLLINDYKEDKDNYNDESLTFYKEGLCVVDVSENEIVLIDDTGDFLHIPNNYYALIGALMHFRQIPINYKY